MERLKRVTSAVLTALCLALFSLAVIGNLFADSLQSQEAVVEPVMTETAMSETSMTETSMTETSMTETAVWEEAYVKEKQQNPAEAVLSASENQNGQEEQEYLKNRLAALRMMRDKSWQQLETQLEGLTDSEKIRRQEQNALLQYKEQRLELLLAAKGFSNCLVVLDEEQANIIVAEQALENQYEKLYDLILRNSDYPAEQIILIPVAANPI